jgi:4-amino-4-deoxy-L-arabinose transferase-like glycosyltransferase
VARRELWWLAGAVLLGVAIRLAYVLITSGHTPVNDELEYHREGLFIEQGKWFWTSLPYGIPHASALKPPLFPLWVGFWDWAFGDNLDLLLGIDAVVFGTATMTLSWLLARRLFGPLVAMATVAVLAVYPFAWQFEVRLFSEGVATPITVLALLCFLDRRPTAWRAAGVGALVGVALLVRPTSLFLLAGVVVAWFVATGVRAGGWRRGLGYSVLSIAVAALVVAPWTYRNHRVTRGLVPISLQDVNAYGTFNDDSANDPDAPYAWRPTPARDVDLASHPRSDIALRSALLSRARHYVADHPFSVVEAFFWNGLTRFWDIRRPRHVLAEVPFEARSRTFTWIGLAMYWVLLAGALVALWRLRRRPRLFWPLVALAIAASIVVTTEAHTRYRAPLEPLIVVLACSNVPTLAARWRPQGGAPAPVVP